MFETTAFELVQQVLRFWKKYPLSEENFASPTTKTVGTRLVKIKNLNLTVFS